MVTRRALIGSLALVLLAGCGSSSGELPEGSELLSQASVSMKAVSSAHFTVKVDGEVPNVPVKEAEGDLTSSGESSGRAKVEQFGQLVEVDFVLVGKDLWVKGPTGGFTKLSSALAGSVYDPTAILDPARGVAKVLGAANGAKTVSSDGGVSVVEATVPAEVAAGLVPGIDADVKARFSVRDEKLVNAVFTMPNGAKATVDLTDLNKLVTVTPPA
ncbi:LppX_LprAFG lipoprotein [Actinosynnema sp. NPDC020468]|uniref:LppX_LprAFG lipoprotein n=1 Tax=Actinosynnema sp. NPDC020468 TaxID=3154488 RepID=UPI0033E4E78C